DDGMRDAGCGDDIAIETPEAAVAADVVQDAVAAEPLVHDPHRPPAPLRQAPRQLIGPAAERVDRRDVAVGQRVAERDDSAGPLWSHNIDAADEEPLVG